MYSKAFFSKILSKGTHSSVLLHRVGIFTLICIGIIGKPVITLCSDIVSLQGDSNVQGHLPAFLCLYKLICLLFIVLVSFLSLSCRFLLLVGQLFLIHCSSKSCV